jgi:hypothetical protein
MLSANCNRARSVPDRAATNGKSWLLADMPKSGLNCGNADQEERADDPQAADPIGSYGNERAKTRLTL